MFQKEQKTAMKGSEVYNKYGKELTLGTVTNVIYGLRLDKNKQYQPYFAIEIQKGDALYVLSFPQDNIEIEKK